MDALLNITVGDLLEQTAAKNPSSLAVKYTEVEYCKTYAEFNAKVDAIAKGLLALGLKKGEHAAVWATNYPQWLELLFATAKIGVVLVTVNTNYKKDELQFLLEQSDSKAVFICDGLKDINSVEIMYSICPELKKADKGKLKSKALPKLQIVCSFDKEYNGIFAFNEIEKLGAKVSDSDYAKAKASLKVDDVVNMQYTSGTTGFPKGVMLTHHNIVNNGYQIGECMKFTTKDKLCIPVPFFHCFGLVLGVLACVAHGSAMVPLLFYSPQKVMAAVQSEKCTALHGVPTMFIGILQHKDFAQYDYSSLRTGIMAGSPCPIKVMQDVVEKMHLTDITIAFGQTESSPVCTQTTVDDSIEKRVSTVGKTLKFLETKIIEPSSGKTLGVGEDGEFCVKGYNVMKGYYKLPEATSAAIDKDGWLHTGDLARMDKDGYYKITGRIKDVIIRGGENIFPKEIEDYIYMHKAVKDVAVVAVPSQKYGEEVCAFIIVKEGQKVQPQEIMDFVLAGKAKHKVPKYVLVVEKFPLTASGKVQKFLLREQAVKMLELDGESIETV